MFQILCEALQKGYVSVPLSVYEREYIKSSFHGKFKDLLKSNNHLRCSVLNLLRDRVSEKSSKTWHSEMLSFMLPHPTLRCSLYIHVHDIFGVHHYPLRAPQLQYNQSCIQQSKFISRKMDNKQCAKISDDGKYFLHQNFKLAIAV